jgi:hypothetical protein
MEQELINFIKTEIEKFDCKTEDKYVYKHQMKIFFNQFDALIELKKIDLDFYKLVKNQVLNNLFSFETFFKKEIVKHFLDSLLLTNDFIKNYEKNN